MPHRMVLMSHPRQSLFRASLTLTGVAALVAAVLIAPPASAAPDEPAPFPAAPKVAPAALNPARSAVPTDQIIVKYKDGAAPAPADRAKTFGAAAAKLGIQIKDVRSTAS